MGLGWMRWSSASEQGFPFHGDGGGLGGCGGLGGGMWYGGGEGLGGGGDGLGGGGAVFAAVT